jgi:hypothetical protein
MALNKAFVNAFNVIAEEQGHEPLKSKEAVDALEKIINFLIDGIAGRTADKLKKANLQMESASGNGGGDCFKYWSKSIKVILKICDKYGKRDAAEQRLDEQDALVNKGKSEKQLKRSFAILMGFCRDNDIDVDADEQNTEAGVGADDEKDSESDSGKENESEVDTPF